MKNTIEQFIQEAKNLRMTDQEKTDMRHILSVHAQTSRPAPAMALPFETWLRRHALASALAVIAIAAGATTVSAHRAEPGDLLYGFRVKVNDRVQVALVADEDAKLEVELRQIERQLGDEEISAEHELSVEANIQEGQNNNDQHIEEDIDLKEMKNIEKDILDAEADVNVDLEI